MKSKRCPTLLIGPPGCGKTARVVGLARESGLPLIYIPLAERDSVEIAGAAVPDAKAGCVRWLDSESFQQARREPVVALLDEITAATRPQRVAALRWCDPSAGLHPETRVFVTANPPEFAAGAGEPLTAPEISRFRIRRVEAEEAIVFLASQTGIVGEVGRFLRANPKAALASPEAMSKAVEEGAPFPTPRSWHMAASEEEADGDASAYEQCVGAAAAAEFLHWRQANDLPNPADILGGNCMVVPSETSSALAVATAIVGLWLGEGKTASEDALNNVVNWFRLAGKAGHAGIVSVELGRLFKEMALRGLYKQAENLLKGPLFEHYGKLIRS
jgi:SpoVK/Ycf46/Vps4 family AAA+-type ATPase